MAADKTFKIDIETTASGTGAEDTRAKLAAVKSEAGAVDAGTFAARQKSLRDALSPVPSELGGDVVAETEKAAVETEKVAAASLLAGTNIARARNEAVTFVRELSTGAPTARTLGALLGSLGPSLIGGALAGIVLKGAIEHVAEAQNKVTRELDEQGEKVVALGKKWSEAARAALTAEDVQKVAESGIEEIDKIGARIRAVASEDLGPVESVLDAIVVGFKNAFTFGGDPNAKGPFQQVADNLMAGLEQEQELLRKQKEQAIDSAEANKKLFDADKIKPAGQAIQDVTNRIKELQREQEALFDEHGRIGANVDSYIALGKQIAVATRELKELNATEKERQRDRDQAAKQAEKDLAGASPQARAILQNEQAAKQATAEGRDRDADQLQRSADQFRRSATPQQAAEADRIDREIRGVQKGDPQIIKELVEQNTKLGQILGIFQQWQ